MDLKTFLGNSYTEFQTKQREDLLSIVSDNLLKAVNDKVMTMVGKDLYNYDDLEEVDEKNYPSLKDVNNSFLDFLKTFKLGEKIVIFKRIDPGHVNHNHSALRLYITNYASLYYVIEAGYSKPVISDYKNIQYKFWIPKDYIYLIKNIGGKTTVDGWGAKGDLNRICAILEHLRDNLFNGHYVKNNIDIHYMDVYIEKQKLEKEKIDFERRKRLERQILIEEKQDLQRKIDALNSEREKYSIIARKIKLERENLAKEREELIKMKVDKINLDDVMTI